MSGGDQDSGDTPEADSGEKTVSEQLHDLANEVRNEEITAERAAEIQDQLENLADEISGTTEHEGGNA